MNIKTTIEDWIVVARGGKFYVLDNESLKSDGIIAHALHSVRDECKDAKELAKQLNEGNLPSRIV